ncbi:prophage protein NinE [Escherichia coli]|uniref:Prophage protein NinE n=1 Tax=Escherichia coli TaxID=562 RepID=A0A377EER3_ECOLX|nr:prophage protein NinE [Escherichia coli]
MATPLIRVMNGHIYRVPNRRKRKPELKTIRNTNTARIYRQPG